jgi:hypothetical protein
MVPIGRELSSPGVAPRASATLRCLGSAGEDVEMIQRGALVLLVFGLLASAGGCGVFHALVYEPFGPNGLCDTTHCRDGSCGSCAACAGPAEESCGAEVPRGRWCRVHRVFGCRACASACDSCGEPCGGVRDCYRPGPLTWLFGLFRCGTFCGSGCGERYWGDWYGDPPDCCDPCDNCGNFTGGSQGRSGYGGAAPEYAAAPARQATCSSCGQPVARASARTARPAAAASSSTYAPRVISQTDRAVRPVEDEEAPHLAQPRRAVPR